MSTQFSLIDLDTEMETSSEVDSIVKELQYPNEAEEEISYRRGVRYVHRFETLEVQDKVAEHSFKGNK
jgi:hypothetical protein